jgi:HTH-type transcriptional regulator / antitoxin HigA
MPYLYQPQDRSKPGDTLRETMAAVNLTPAALARKTGLPLREATALLASRIPIAPGVAAQLEKALGTPAVFWRKLDANYRTSVNQSRTKQIHRTLVLCALCVLRG